MPRDITVQFEDGSSHIYSGAPDDATPEQVYARASKDFASKKVVHLDGGRGTASKKEEPGFLESIGAGAKGTAEAVGDIAQGLWKIPAAAAFTTIGKFAAPQISTQKHWEAAQSALDEHFPSFASDPNNIGYKAPMYPFEKFGEGINYVAKKASMGNEDVEGAINVGGNFLPIPFAGKAGRGAKKVIEAVDPGLRPDTAKPKIADPVLDRVDQHLTTPEPVEANPGAAAFDNIVGSQINGAVSPLPNRISPMESVVSGLEQQRMSEAQRVIEERQRAMEQEVARQSALDRQAADRARQEQAPTGYEQWAEQQRQAAEQRQPGNNTPMDFESPYPVRAADYPNVLGDQPHQYTGGVDWPLAEQKALPVTVADHINQGLPKRSPMEVNPMDRANQILSGSELARKRPAKDTPRRGGRQSGAIDLKTLEEGFEKLKTLPNGVKLHAFAEGDGQLNVIAHDANGKYIGGTRMSPENYRNPKADDFMSSLSTDSSHKGLATEMYKFVSELGNDIVPSKSQTEAGKAMWAGFERNGLSSGGKISRQSGKFDMKGISDAAERGAERIRSAVKGAMSSRTDADKVLGMAMRDDSFVAKPMSGEDMVAKALTEEPKKQNVNTQSGLVSSGDKANSTVLRETGRWLNWANSLTKKLTREHVVPVERFFSRLSETELQHAMQIAMKEDGANKRLTPEQLRDAGVSDKTIEALQAFRKETDTAISRVNALNKELGRPEVTSREAYFSSSFNGDYKIPVISKDGKRVLGFATAHTIGEAKKALAWIKKNMPEANAKIIDRRDNTNGRSPKDVTNLYNTLLDVFKDTPVGAELQQLMERHSEVQGFSERGFWKHFEEKSGTRFFIGDRPWLNAKENATQAAQAQVRYLKDVYNWLPTQEMMVEMKKVLNNEQLLEAQPTTVALAHGYVDNYLGNSNNKWKMIEDTVAQLMGTSTGRMKSFIAGMKTMTYWMQLGFSGGYMLATPLQMLPFGTAFHMQLSREGIKHNPILTTAKALRDANYAFQIDLGQHFDANWSKADRTFANDAIRYMEDNGVNNKSLRDEYASLGSHPAMDAAGKVIDKTITFPDYVSRTIGFLSFAHHLRDGNPSMPQLEVFRRAAELTDKSAVPLERHNRPLMFDKMGMVGEMASMYKAPVFQFWNNLAELGNHAMKTKDVKPFVAALMIAYGLGGVSSLPGFGEADSAVEFLKDMNAKYGSKELAVATKDWGLKTMALTHLGELSTYGPMSSMTNTALSSRFSPQGFDFQKPLNIISPVVQEATEWGSALGALKHHDTESVQQGIYDAVAPPIGKGLMENHLDNFHGQEQNGRTPAYKPSDIRHPEVMYDRTAGDKMRRNFGLYSLEESKTKEIASRVGQDERRMNTVREKLGADIAASILKQRDPTGDIKLFVQSGGEQKEFDSLLQQNLIKAVANPQTRELLRANLLREFQAIQRKQAMGVNYQ